MSSTPVDFTASAGGATASAGGATASAGGGSSTMDVTVLPTRDVRVSPGIPEGSVDAMVAWGIVEGVPSEGVSSEGVPSEGVSSEGVPSVVFQGICQTEEGYNYLPTWCNVVGVVESLGGTVTPNPDGTSSICLKERVYQCPSYVDPRKVQVLLKVSTLGYLKTAYPFGFVDDRGGVSIRWCGSPDFHKLIMCIVYLACASICVTGTVTHAHHMIVRMSDVGLFTSVSPTSRADRTPCTAPCSCPSMAPHPTPPTAPRPVPHARTTLHGPSKLAFGVCGPSTFGGRHTLRNSIEFLGGPVFFEYLSRNMGPLETVEVTGRGRVLKYCAHEKCHAPNGPWEKFEAIVRADKHCWFVTISARAKNNRAISC
jgi:hypothetical protein